MTIVQRGELACQGKSHRHADAFLELDMRHDIEHTITKLED